MVCECRLGKRKLDCGAMMGDSSWISLLLFYFSSAHYISLRFAKLFFFRSGGVGVLTLMGTVTLINNVGGFSVGGLFGDVFLI